MNKKTSSGWVAVDLDGTLARYDGWKGERHIGEPIQLMVDRVKQHLAGGDEVKIFTARVSGDRVGIEPGETQTIIQDWCEKYIGARLPVTCQKDFGMICCYDDRAKQVVPNFGRLVEDEYIYMSEKVIEVNNLRLEAEERAQKAEARVRELEAQRIELTQNA